MTDSSIEQQVAGLDVAGRQAWLAKLSGDLLLDVANRAWWYVSRPHQVPPTGAWRWFLACAGRGWGKTRACAEWIVAKARRYPGARCALVAITFADGRDTMVEGESGLLSVLAAEELRGGSVGTAWNRSMGELHLANGSRFKIFSSEKPRQLRGPQHHFSWGDEPAYWIDARRGVVNDSTFSNLNFGLRLPARKGWDNDYRPQGVFATTPRRIALLKVGDNIVRDKPEAAGLLQRTDVLVVRGSTKENLQNLSKEYRETVIDPLIGTVLGRQELDAELVDEVEGALWTQQGIDDDRITLPANVTTAERVAAAPDLVRIVVAIDPAVSVSETSDETGIVAVGRGVDGLDYVLADHSGKVVGTDAARRAWHLWKLLEADELTYETNQGGDWVRDVLLDVWTDLQKTDPDWPAGSAPLKPVHAKRGKRLRAEPIAARYEQHRVRHVGRFPVLEAQQTEWVPDQSDSPDRLDALVYGLQRLRDTEGLGASMSTPPTTSQTLLAAQAALAAGAPPTALERLLGGAPRGTPAGPRITR